MLVRLLGGPRHGERFDMEAARDIIQVPYRVDDGSSSDPLDVTFGIGTYPGREGHSPTIRLT